MNDNLDADLEKMLADENVDAGPRGVGYYVPGPGGGLIHTYDADVAQVGREERYDPSDDYDPTTHNPRTCHIGLGECPGCNAAEIG